MNKLINGNCLDVLKTLEDESINCCITSPPYWGLRDYGVDNQLGLEETPEKYVDNMVNVFREVKRVLKDDGTLWLNLGDSYAGVNATGRRDTETIASYGKGTRLEEKKKKFSFNIKAKNLMGIPWRVAFALQADGWYLRQDIIWHKPNPMPESVTDRCTKAHEYIFLLSKNKKYYYDYKSIQEKSIWFEHDNRSKTGPTTGGEKTNTGIYAINKAGAYQSNGMRNKRSVWTVTTKPYKEAHFATFPEDLILPCVLAGCPKGGIILDPFAGAGTTGVVAKKNNRNFIGIELNNEYLEMAKERIKWTKQSLF